MAYILTWVTGLIVLLTAKKEEKFKRWHAIQAIGFGIIVVLFYIVVNIVLVPMAFTSPGAAATGAMIAMLLNLLIVVAIIMLAVWAYQGKTVRIPVVAGFADKNA